jgi:signal transduction histidine kinase
MTQLAKIRPYNAHEYMGEIDESARHMLKMINDVLDISSLDHGAFSLTDAPFDINAMLNDILRTAMHNASAKNQILNIHIDPFIPEKLSGDEKRLKQVIANLLANAVKYTQEHGSITFDAHLLSSESEAVTLQFSITDTGIGISAEHQVNLFESFEQVDGGLTRKQGGIGIGLALSKRIVEMMGGKIYVISDTDKGSTFTFTCVMGRVAPAL